MFRVYNFFVNKYIESCIHNFFVDFCVKKLNKIGLKWKSLCFSMQTLNGEKLCDSPRFSVRFLGNHAILEVENG